MAAERIPGLVALVAGVIYGAFYLYATGDLDAAPSAGWRFEVGQLSLSHMLSARGPFLFEAVALLQVGPIFFMISPLNLFITAALGMLLALNLHGALMLWRYPAACSLEHASGGSAGSAFGSALPALLAGGACCAPSLILLLGVPGLGAFVGLFAWLIPISAVALVANRWWQRRQGAPGLLGL